jgi:ribosomal protein S18 acetylase RimI-like enzyme
MLIEDWRAVSPGEARDLLDRERRRWLKALEWDPADAWTLVEEARCAGTVPGFVAREDGRIVGWTFFVVHDGVLKIGALEGEGAEAVRGLLEAVLDAPETRFASEYHCFLFPGHPSVEAALARRRFELDRQAYLERTLASRAVDRPVTGRARVRAWKASDLPGLVRLFARAYACDDLSRCFAPHGRLDEWAEYLSQVIRGPALGEFEPACSWVSVSGPETHPHGGLLATWVAPATLHVAQVAVDPGARGHGLARSLMEAAIASAASHGATRVTLLVAASNAAAVGLYRKLQFIERATFLFGWRERPTRVLQARLAPRAASDLWQEAG